jgi:integrase
MRTAHSVPLSDAAVALLGSIERGASPYIFPGAIPRRPLSVMSLKMRMNGLGAGAWTPHGMRSAFRSWAADTGVAFEVAESCLAHTSNSVVQAYQRSDMLERRRPVMQSWADFLDGKAGGEVVPFKKGKRSA